MVLRRLKLLGVIVLFLFAVSLYLLYKDMNSSTARRIETLQRKDHLLCVLIPYRNRWEELKILVPRLQEFLDRQVIQHHFVVLNQTDNYRFNRASLINVGWFEADRLGCDYFVMHDVDIVPLNPQLDYRYPGKDRIKHISAGKYHPIKRYDYPKFIGGVLMLPMELYKRVDGMSNKYWGWGLEDDEFFLRLKEANLTERIDRPTNLTTDRSNTFMHVHGKDRKRDYAVYHKQLQMSRRRDRISGLHSVKYTIVTRSILELGTANATVLHIALDCDTNWTPYCQMTETNLKPKQ